MNSLTNGKAPTQAQELLHHFLRPRECQPESKANIIFRDGVKERIVIKRLPYKEATLLASQMGEGYEAQFI